MQTPERQVDPCTGRSSLPRSESFRAVKHGAPQHGDFRQLASLQAFPGTTVPVRICGTLRRGARVVPSLSAPSGTLALFIFFFALVDKNLTRRWRDGREETKESSTERRHKKISREIHGRTVTAGALRDLTQRQRVPLSYQLIAGRFLSLWDVFSHGLQSSFSGLRLLSVPRVLLPIQRPRHDVRVRAAMYARLPILIYENRVTRP